MWFPMLPFLLSERQVLKQGCRCSGFTLLEVMIAVAIIAIAVVTLLGAQSQSVSIAASAKFDTRASLLARWKMADLELQEFTGLVDDEGNFGEDYPEYRWKLRVTDLGENDTGLTGTSDQIKMLDIIVYASQENAFSYSLRTFIANVAQQEQPLNEQADPPQKQSSVEENNVEQ